MFFLFGTQEREELRGEVVDRCPQCQRLGFQSLVDHYRVWHAYFVPVGRGKYRLTTGDCHQCGARVELDPNAFASILPKGASKRTSLEEGARLTNPAVSTVMAAVTDIERLATQTPYRGSDDERRESALRDAARWLRELVERGEDVSAYSNRFLEWRQLGAEARSELVAELRGYARAKGVEVDSSP